VLREQHAAVLFPQHIRFQRTLSNRALVWTERARRIAMKARKIVVVSHGPS
jgi:hypothetical protein